MLSSSQNRLLETVPLGLQAHIEPFDMRTQEAAYRLLDDLSRMCPTCHVHYIGSTKLGIGGSNKIDIVVIAHDQRTVIEQGLEGLFGASKPGDFYEGEQKWETSRNGFAIMIRLVTEPDAKLHEHLDVQRILEARGDLRHKYAQLKSGASGTSLKDFLQKKFEFFNAVLEPRV